LWLAVQIGPLPSSSSSSTSPRGRGIFHAMQGAPVLRGQECTLYFIHSRIAMKCPFSHRTCMHSMTSWRRRDKKNNMGNDEEGKSGVFRVSQQSM
jgi:hypothetical protein